MNYDPLESSVENKQLGSLKKYFKNVLLKYE
jgi:hypothetical protein